MVAKNWLDPFIKASKVESQEKLADLIGVSRATINRLANDHSKLKKDRAEQLSGPLGVTVDELMLNTPPSKKVKDNRAKLVASYDPDNADTIEADVSMSIGSETGLNGAPEGSSAQIDVTGGMGGGGLSIINEGVPGKHGMTFAADQVKDYWRLPPSILVALGLSANDVSIVSVQGDSMQPTLDEGDCVFIDTRHRWPSPDGLYAILDEVGGLVIKRLEISSHHSAERQTISVISDNPRHKTKEWLADELRIVGRVLRRFGIVK
jgi:transcriptional regulator with XRE-family HTH domain